MSLNLFPARVPIGKVMLPDGTELNTLASPEFLRALWALFERVGGDDAMDNENLFMIAMQTLLSQQPAPAAPDLQWMHQSDSSLATELAALRQQVAQLTQLVSAPAAQTERTNYSEFLQAYAEPSARLDWERPGKIGAMRANTGKFTTLTATGAVSLSPANADVVLSPTGTGVVTISPATVGSINKVNIGAVTPGTGAFTTFSATGNATVGDASAVVTAIINGTNSGAAGGAYCAVKNGGAFVLALGNFSAINGGAYDATPTVYYPTNIIFSRSGTTTGEIFNSRLVMGPTPTDPGGTVYLKSMGGIQAVTGFGCNSKTPQTAVASGGALAAYGAGANGLDSGANMSALHALVVSIRSALVANGIMS